jgi:hypothetical protein
VIFSDPEKNWITGQIVAVDGGLVTTSVLTREEPIARIIDALIAGRKKVG